MTKQLFKRYATSELAAVQRFHLHPFFTQFNTLSEEALRTYLLQRTTLSKEFLTWYNLAMVKLKDRQAKDVIRGIVQVEVGVKENGLLGFTHFEDLVADLGKINITPNEIIEINATPTTTNMLARLFGLIVNATSDLEIMVALRIAGEILVSEEYGYVIRKFHFGAKDSRFFHPHYLHDGIETGDHPGAFVQVITRLLSDSEQLALAVSTVDRATDARLSFFDQFVDVHEQ